MKIKNRYKKVLKKIQCSIKIKTFYYTEPWNSYYYEFYLIIDGIKKFSGYCYRLGDGYLPKFIGGDSSSMACKNLIRSNGLYIELIKLFRKYKWYDDEALGLGLWFKSAISYEAEI